MSAPYKSGAHGHRDRLKVTNFGLIATSNKPPADGDLRPGQCALWFDSTAGSAKINFKAKDAAGTVTTGQLTPAPGPTGNDAQVAGAGSAVCNGIYVSVNSGAYYDGPGGLQIQTVPDYPAVGKLSFCIVDSSSRIFYVGPDSKVVTKPWGGPWTVGSFGAAPAPTVTQY